LAGRNRTSRRSFLYSRLVFTCLPKHQKPVNPWKKVSLPF
jgi:hypothetical protein